MKAIHIDLYIVGGLHVVYDLSARARVTEKEKKKKTIILHSPVSHL